MKRKYGIYIHIPFCQAKCGYCDFSSTARRGNLAPSYVHAAVHEIAHLAPMMADRSAVSIFFGGGTPSLLSEAMVTTILEACSTHLRLDPQAEITLEANPESLSLKKAQGFRHAGANRISLGIQSLNDTWLKALGRIHTASKARHAVELAREAGFDNISADMMFALPDQSVLQWNEDLMEAVGLGLDHISCYQLTPEMGTILGDKVQRGIIALPQETADYFDSAEKILMKAGYIHYEISNYAKKGRECVHNLGYWEYRDYLGIGSAAHGMVDGQRWANVQDPARYISRIKASGRGAYHTENLTPEKIRLERLMLGLRLKKGILLDGMEITPEIKSLVKKGLLRLPKGRLAATPKGWRLLDSVLAAI